MTRVLLISELSDKNFIEGNTKISDIKSKIIDISNKKLTKNKNYEEKNMKKSRKLSRIALNFCRYVGMGIANSSSIIMYYPEISSIGNNDYRECKFSESFCRTMCASYFP